MRNVMVLDLRLVSGLVVMGLLILYVPCARAAKIYVPADHSTIQAAIEVAVDGDEIIVSPGTYGENIDFLGKQITVKSTDPNDSNVVTNTIIDGGQAGCVVTFDNGEGNNSVLSGVTIRNGNSSGVYCGNCSPTISNCTICENTATNIPPIYLGYLVGGGGGGIICLGGSPIISNCIIE